MTRHALILLAISIATPALAQDKPGAPAAPSPKVENLLQNCDAHKFETIIQSTVEGKPHGSKLKMCGNEGQSDADWIKTLEDAVAKVQSNATMPESTRNQIVTAVRAEIARLRGEITPPAEAGSLPAGRPQPSPDTLANDYSVLPPLPKSAPAPTRVLDVPLAGSSPAGSTVTVAADQSPAPLSAPSAAPAPLLAKPKIGLSCISPDFPSGGPCVTLSRDTTISVRAAEPLEPGVSLRFIREGDQKAEFPLGSMRKGQSVRFALPQPVCSGVSSSEVVIAVIRNGRVVDKQGPSLLHC